MYIAGLSSTFSPSRHVVVAEPGVAGPKPRGSQITPCAGFSPALWRGASRR